MRILKEHITNVGSKNVQNKTETNINFENKIDLITQQKTNNNLDFHLKDIDEPEYNLK